MLLNIVALAVVVVFAVLFAWLFFRAGRFNRPVYRLAGRLVGGLGTLGFLALAGIMGRGLYMLYMPRPVEPIEIAVTGSDASSVALVARGEHLASSLCAACHTTTGELPLSGGINLSDDIGMPFGDLYAPNLTPAGSVNNMSDADIWRLFRHGVLPDGRLALMPMSALKNLSDADLQAVIAYLRSQPAVDGTTPEISTTPLLALVMGAGMYPVQLQPIKEAVVAPEKGPTVEYGQYIVSYSDCVSCHGPALDGKMAPPLPAGPNLRVVKGWTAEQFINTMRTGVNPGGHALQPPMPWKAFSNLDDVELKAMWAYLASLE